MAELDAKAKGERYFDVDPGYDKRVYISDCKNILVIMAILIVYYGFNIIFWWGMTSFGCAYTDASMWYNVAIFLYTTVFIAGLLISGRYSNRKHHLLEHYLEIINDKKQDEKDKLQREKQKEEQQKMIAQSKSQKSKGHDDDPVEFIPVVGNTQKPPRKEE